MEKILIYLLARIKKAQNPDGVCNAEIALYTSLDLWKAMERMDKANAR